MNPSPIYVEIQIRGAMDELWRLTQTPHLHQQWDLRFNQIEYLPRPDPAQPQKFLYATRIGFGLRIAGEGESVGENNGPAGRASALKFWSNDFKSLIHEGSGYWKYVPGDAGEIRFLTRYDYRTRFGLAGRIIDRFLFRPLLGWATAWSFDRLRLWIERGLQPAVLMRQTIIHAVARIALALAWIYQGLVPKLLFAEQSGEIATLGRFGVFAGNERQILTIVAIAEIAFGLLLLTWWRARRLFMINLIAMIVLAIAVMANAPSLFVGQFNPFSLNLSMIALSIIGWMAARDLPTARNCLRRESRADS